MARLWQWRQSKAKRMKKKKEGFGLIELLISSSLILFLVAGTAQLLGLSLAAKRNADFHFRAARLASSRLESLHSFWMFLTARSFSPSPRCSASSSSTTADC